MDHIRFVKFTFALPIEIIIYLNLLSAAANKFTFELIDLLLILNELVMSEVEEWVKRFGPSAKILELVI